MNMDSNIQMLISKERKGYSYADFPDEILLMVFGELDPIYLHETVKFATKRWLYLAKDKSLEPKTVKLYSYTKSVEGGVKKYGIANMNILSRFPTTIQKVHLNEDTDNCDFAEFHLMMRRLSNCANLQILNVNISAFKYQNVTPFKELLLARRRSLRSIVLPGIIYNQDSSIESMVIAVAKCRNLRELSIHFSDLPLATLRLPSKLEIFRTLRYMGDLYELERLLKENVNSLKELKLKVTDLDPVFGRELMNLKKLSKLSIDIYKTQADWRLEYFKIGPIDYLKIASMAIVDYDGKVCVSKNVFYFPEATCLSFDLKCVVEQLLINKIREQCYEYDELMAHFQPLKRNQFRRVTKLHLKDVISFGCSFSYCVKYRESMRSMFRNLVLDIASMFPKLKILKITIFRNFFEICYDIWSEALDRFPHLEVFKLYLETIAWAEVDFNNTMAQYYERILTDKLNCGYNRGWKFEKEVNLHADTTRFRCILTINRISMDDDKPLEN